MEIWDFQSKKLKSFAGLLFHRSGIKEGSKQNTAGYSTSAAHMKTLLTLCLTVLAMTAFAQNRPANPPPPPPPPNLQPAVQNPPPPATTNPGAPINPAAAQAPGV